MIGGWDGRKALNSVEFYNSEKREWEESRRTRLAQERRWDLPHYHWLSSLSLIISIIISTTIIVTSITLIIAIIRWAAATQISHKLFSYCVQKRSWEPFPSKTPPPHVPMSPPSTKPTKPPSSPPNLPTTQTPKMIVIQKLWGVRRRLFIICWKRGWSRLIFCEKCEHIWWYFCSPSIASNLYSV